ncbi:hypothetical protein BDW22DRAFT_411358 [Trametopsis cervina]|nr:hypothetical protein BDW22DRAFT_411358 [Trametopsis cervina]
MPVTILASFSLLALVVTARPLAPASPSSEAARKRSEPSSDLQDVVQAVFQSRIGQSAECFDTSSSCGDDAVNIRVQVTSEEEQKSVLAKLEGLDAIKAVVPLELLETQAEDEKTLYGLLTGYTSKATTNLNDLDGTATPLPPAAASLPDDVAQSSHVDQPVLNEAINPTSAGVPAVPHNHGSPQLLVLTFACLTAFVSLGAVVGLFFLRYLVHTLLLDSVTAWDLLPGLEQQLRLPITSEDDNNDSDGDTVEKRTLPPDAASCDDDDLPLSDESKNLLKSPGDETTSASDHDEDGSDEKFHDAEGNLIDFEADVLDAPTIILTAAPDPCYLPLPSDHDTTPFATPAPSPPGTPVQRPLQMREIPSPSVTRPAWSLRAADAPALGLTSSAPVTPLPIPRLSRKQRESPETSLSIPGSFSADEEHNAVALADSDQTANARQRAYRSPVPELGLDIAFAMQLRPGLGLGSDPAWLVRFLMAMFGWMSVLLGGNVSVGDTTRRGRRALLG